MGQRTVEGPGQWRFDANLQKSFKISESKALQFRMDARNILNHPEPNAPTLSINTTNFGTINGKTTLHEAGGEVVVLPKSVPDPLNTAS